MSGKSFRGGDVAIDPPRRAERSLDITSDVCPMTFVRVRLALDRMAPGEVLAVLLRGDEPRRNVPETSRTLGHTVLAVEDGADGSTRVWIGRGG